MFGKNMSSLFHILRRTESDPIQLREAHQLMQKIVIILTNIPPQRIDNHHLSSLFLESIFKLDANPNWCFFFIL